MEPTHFPSAYGEIAATTGDSTAAGNPPTIFKVVGRNASGSLYWLSASDSGYSVDNLAPAAPAPFTGAYVAGATHLHWAANTEADLAGYRLYRGGSAGFVTGQGSLVAARADTGFADVAPSGSFYKLSAVDVHGNESAFALLTPAATTAVGASIPRALALALASECPGRGGASLRYALPRAGRCGSRSTMRSAARCACWPAACSTPGSAPCAGTAATPRGDPPATASTWCA